MANAYVWCGIGSNEHEVECANKVVTAFPQKPASTAVIKEGEEGDDFWESVGGKGEYSTSKESMMAPNFEPRLFHVSNSTGYTFMKEITRFK